MSKSRIPCSLALMPSRQQIGPSDLEIALGKARAARILLRADADYLQIPVTLKPGESEQEIRSWIESFAFDALDAALDEAEAARQKIQGAPLLGASR